jgi:hypothetical protein
MADQSPDQSPDHCPDQPVAPCQVARDCIDKVTGHYSYTYGPPEYHPIKQWDGSLDTPEYQQLCEYCKRWLAAIRPVLSDIEKGQTSP